MADDPRVADRTDDSSVLRAVPWLLAVVGAAVTVLVYWPALHAGWVFDDYPNLLVHPALNWTALSGETWDQLVNATLIPRRIVANASFGLNHLVFGPDPLSYHAVNIAVHLMTGAALGWLGYRYLRAAGARVDRATLLRASVAAAVLFLLHPLNTQAVAYVVQRMASLAALFCTVAFAAYLTARTATTRSRRTMWYSIAALAWALALGCKENAVALVGVVALYEVSFHREVWGAWMGAALRSRRGKLTVLAAAAVGLLAVVVALRMYAGGNPINLTTTWQSRGFSGLERMLTQGRVLVLYASLLVWPAPGRLSLEHPTAVSRGLLDPWTTFPSWVFWIGIAGLGVWLLRRRPIYGFPVLAYLAYHAIEAGPVNLELVFEHRMYLPMTMLALLAAAGLSSVKSSAMKPVGIIVVGVSILLGWATYQRNVVWGDPVAFARDVAAKSPDDFRSVHNLSVVLIDAGEPFEALEVAYSAVALDPENHEAYAQLGLALMEADSLPQAMQAYQQALTMQPGNFRAAYQVGEAIRRHSGAEQALAYYMDAGMRMAMDGYAFQAISLLERAVGLDTASSAARNALGNALWMAGRLDGAVVRYQEAVERDSTNAEAWYNLGRVLEQQGDAGEAEMAYQRFIEVAPSGYARQVQEVTAKLQSGRQ